MGHGKEGDESRQQRVTDSLVSLISRHSTAREEGSDRWGRERERGVERRRARLMAKREGTEGRRQTAAAVTAALQ